MPAHAAYTWITQHLPRPFMVPLGTVARRGKLGSSVISDRLAQRTSIFLCASCEHKMPRDWLRRYEYCLIPGFHSEATRCDACQEMDSANIFHAEDGGYYREHQRLERIGENAVAVQVAVRDRRRVRV